MRGALETTDRAETPPRGTGRGAWVAVLGGLGILSLAAVLWGREPDEVRQKAPELEKVSRWINSKSLKLAELRGKVVVLHFWTFGCINCRRNLPYYNAWHRDLTSQGVRLVGVHTPEFPQEENLETVAARVKELEIEYPVAVDNQHAVWRDYDNQYWPSIYLIDKQGQVRYRWEGELEYRDAGGDRGMRAKIAELLAEPDSAK